MILSKITTLHLQFCRNLYRFYCIRLICHIPLVTPHLSFWKNLYTFHLLRSYLSRLTCHSGRICTRPTCPSHLSFWKNLYTFHLSHCVLERSKWNVYRFFQNDKWGVTSGSVASGTCTDSSRMTSGTQQVERVQILPE